MPADRGLAREKVFLTIALILVAAGFGYAYLTSPTWLTVAVGPAGSPDDKLLRAFAEQLKAQRVAIRLKFLPVADVRAAAEALDRKAAALAVVRPDVLLPASGLTTAILRDAAAIIVTPTSTGFDELPDLAGKTLGVVLDHEADPQFVETILKHFDLGPPVVSIVPLAREDVVPAFKSGRINAVAILATPAGIAASEFVRSIAQAYSGKVTILPVANPDGILQRSPGASAVSIPDGIWGGRPKVPDEEIKTVGVSYLLMARSDVDRSAIALTTESLFQMRSRLAPAARSAIFMRAPDTETTSSATSATLPNHPGAVDYFQREQQTVMDRYGDWIYLFAFFGSGLISLAAAFWQRFRRRSREAIDDVLDRLLAILSDARTAESPRRLDEITAEIDDLLALAVGHARAGETGRRTTSALVIALDGARSAVEDRRRQIGRSDEEASRSGDAPRRRLAVLSAGQLPAGAGRGSPST